MWSSNTSHLNEDKKKHEKESKDSIKTKNQLKVLLLLKCTWIVTNRLKKNINIPSSWQEERYFFRVYPVYPCFLSGRTKRINGSRSSLPLSCSHKSNGSLAHPPLSLLFPSSAIVIHFLTIRLFRWPASNKCFPSTEGKRQSHSTANSSPPNFFPLHLSPVNGDVEGREWALAWAA